MKSILPILSFVVVLASCSTAYKSGQTPDDVYFSPVPPKVEHTQNEEKEVREEKRQTEEYSAYEDDRYLRMKVRDRSRWSSLDDYYRDPYAYTYSGCYCNCNVNPRLYWSYHNSPYNYNVVISNPRAPIYSKPRTFNLGSYSTTNTNTSTKSPSQSRRTYSTPVRVNTSSNNAGNTLRDIFRSTDNSSSNSNSSSTSKPSTSSSSSSSSSSTNNGNAPVRRF